MCSDNRQGVSVTGQGQRNRKQRRGATGSTQHPHNGDGRAATLLNSLYLIWKFCTFTFLYGAVLRWHQRSSPSLAVSSTTCTTSWVLRCVQRSAHGKPQICVCNLPKHRAHLSVYTVKHVGKLKIKLET